MSRWEISFRFNNFLRNSLFSIPESIFISTFLTKSLIDKDNLFEESENINFDKIIDEEDYPIYNKVMSFIENH